MTVKQRLFSNMFLRNMLTDLGKRSADATTAGKFIPYFQYRIDHYQPDYYLYFPKKPYAIRYKNEAFNKLQEYSGYDLIQYLDFHYTAYSDKADFLRFLQYEISDRLKKKPSETRRQKLHAAAEWAAEQRQELHRVRQEALKSEIERGVNDILSNNNGQQTPNNIEAAVHTLVQKISDHVAQIMTSTEEKMQALTDSYIIGKIELNNQNHEDKLMKLFKLLQTVQAPPKIARAEQLFNKFSDTDIAAILWLHFSAFKNKKIETIPRNIRKADELIPDKNPRVKQLTDALRDYFYS